MASKKKTGGRRRRKIPIIATAGLVMGLLNFMDKYKESRHAAMVSLTGYDPNYGFNWKWATSTIPIVIGAAGSMVAAKSGINRYMNIPMFKL